MKPKLATLTKAEAVEYASGFEFYMNNVRKDTKRADGYAWRAIVRTFPRLAAYKGARP